MDGVQGRMRDHVIVSHVQGRTKQHVMLSHVQGCMAHAQGLMRQPLLCEYCNFRPFFKCSSVLLELQINLVHFVLSSNASENHWTSIFNLHILDPSLNVLFCRFTRFFTKKDSKHMWSCMISDKTELQRLKWNQYKKFFKSLTTHLIDF